MRTVHHYKIIRAWIVDQARVRSGNYFYRVAIIMYNVIIATIYSYSKVVELGFLRRTVYTIT